MAAPPALINNGGYPLSIVDAASFDNIQLPPTATNNLPLYGRIQLSFFKNHISVI
jgi:hypothetical protein